MACLLTCLPRSISTRAGRPRYPNETTGRPFFFPQMTPSRRLLTLASALSLAVVRATGAASAALTIRGDAPYQLFDGIGGMSSGGTSRLLLDYPPQQQSEILDLLFLPQFGMSSSILKLEVGGDSQSTDGTEAAFKHFREEPAQCGTNRGFEMWMLSEAAKRNPAVQSFLLSWGIPRE